MAFSRSKLSSTEDCQKCLKTYSPVNSALSLNLAFGHILHVLSSNRILFSSNFAVLIGRSLHTCPPITGPGSKCQNIIRLTQLDPQRLLCHRGSPHRRRPGGNTAFTTEALITHRLSGLQKHTWSRSRVVGFTLLMIRSPQYRRQSETGQNPERAFWESD